MQFGRKVEDLLQADPSITLSIQLHRCAFVVRSWNANAAHSAGVERRPKLLTGLGLYFNTLALAYF
jgi:hypothetical protein